MSALKTYHHGNLSEAALVAARATVEEFGHDQLSMRSLAQQLGVVPSALYRHFTGRGVLLAALTNQLHGALKNELEKVILATSDPWLALEEAGRSFLLFAKNNKQLFRMMYDAEVTNSTDSEDHLPMLKDGYMLLFQLFRKALPHSSLLDVRLRVLGYWSTIFGYANVTSQGALRSYMTTGLSVEAIELAVLSTALGHTETEVLREIH